MTIVTEVLADIRKDTVYKVGAHIAKITKNIHGCDYEAAKAELGYIKRWTGDTPYELEEVSQITQTAFWQCHYDGDFGNRDRVEAAEYFYIWSEEMAR